MSLLDLFEFYFVFLRRRSGLYYGVGLSFWLSVSGMIKDPLSLNSGVTTCN